MSGYHGYSMSNNAVTAYENGEKPLSKWTKINILKSIDEQEIDLKCSMKKLQKLPIKLLKEICLIYSSWHHTGNYYNITRFYSLDVDTIKNLTDKKLDELITDYKKNIKDQPAEEKWKCSFLEWSGSKKHPKATEIIEEGIIKGDWFYRKDGSKKKIKANGFRFIEKIGG